MRADTDSKTRAEARNERQFPAYGPIDALLGYLLWYVLVERTTSTIVGDLSEILLDVSPSVVRVGLAAFRWFVLAVPVLDQARRQSSALGVIGDDGDGGSRFLAGFDAGTVSYAMFLLVGGVSRGGRSTAPSGRGHR